MDRFLNKDEAMQFINEVQDPVVRDVLLRAYGSLIFQLAPVEVKGQFDLLFFFKVVEALLRDREGLAMVLRGQPADGDETPPQSQQGALTNISGPPG